MSLSFEDSVKNNAIAALVEPKKAIMAAATDVGVMTLDESYGIAAYSGDDGNWQQHNGYVRYSAFSDSDISVINDRKDIALNQNQINITQEENSQYIPFEMPRYYDGFDVYNPIR